MGNSRDTLMTLSGVYWMEVIGRRIFNDGKSMESWRFYQMM